MNFKYFITGGLGSRHRLAQYNPVTKLANTRAQDEVLVLSADDSTMWGVSGRMSLGSSSWSSGFGKTCVWKDMTSGDSVPGARVGYSPGLGITLNSNVRRMAQLCTGTRMERTT